MSTIMRKGLGREDLRAVIFDLDGTLIRSTIDFVKMNRAIAETLLKHGLPEDILDPNGRVNESIVRAYSYFKAHSQSGWIDGLERDLNRVSAEVEMALVDKTMAVPGAFETLAHLEEKKMPAAILTRGSRAYTMKALRASGIEGRFHTVVCRDDYSLTEAKPNPIALRRVFDHLALNNRQCLFIGDHETDFLCAKGADVPFAAVLTGSHDQEVWGSLMPDLIMRSIADLPAVLEGRI
ncbi:MAG: HAD family hydrolase [Methanomassiliicoccales archaeon]|nr:HAD family hydrolase [Methanomassiliicoccales archaeon]